MNRSDYIAETKRLIETGELTTLVELQEKNSCSRTKAESEVEKGRFVKIRLFKNFILIKNK